MPVEIAHEREILSAGFSTRADIIAPLIRWRSQGVANSGQLPGAALGFCKRPISDLWPAGGGLLLPFPGIKF